MMKFGKITFNRRRILYILLVIFLIIIVSFFSYFLFFRKFYVKEFEDNLVVDCKENYKLKSGDVCYGNIFFCETVKVEKKGKVDTNKLGKYEIIYKYKYKDKVLEKKQVINVVDREKPSLEVEGDNFSYCPNGRIPDYKVKAVDNYDGDLSGKVTSRIEDEKIIFSVVDSSLNTTQVVKEAVSKDDEKPVLTLKGDSTQYINLYGNYSELGGTALDNCDGDISSKIEIVGNVNTNKLGEYKITYKIKDSSSNENSVTRRVIVYQKKNYVTPNGSSIYLTFDDGPGPYTEKLLNVLKKYNVKATFFVTNQGFTKGYDNLILRAYNEGHTIGLHSNTHSYNIYSNKNVYFQDLYAIQDKVRRITGYTSMIIRFPGGSSNTVSRRYDGGTKIMSQLSKEVEARGFRYFDWNISSGDAGETTSTNQIVSNIIRGLGSGSTYVILQHDVKDYSVNAVESVIKYGLSHGYTFRAITMSTPNIHHSINN